jgi:hypothetical protein
VTRPLNRVVKFRESETDYQRGRFALGAREKAYLQKQLWHACNAAIVLTDFDAFPGMPNRPNVSWGAVWERTPNVVARAAPGAGQDLRASKC